MNFEKHLIHSFEIFGREPLIRRMDDGSIICLFLTGGPREPDNGNVLMMSRSVDDGKTWTEPEVILTHSRRGIWATELFHEEGQTFIVVHTYNAECHYRELETFLMYTHDSGYTWSEPVSLPGNVNGVTLRQGFVMSNGEWFFPTYWQETTYDFDWTVDTSKEEGRGERFPFRCGAAISSDKGKTFSAHGYITKPYSLWEPNAIEAEPGHIIMLMRIKGPDARLERSDSYDYGRTWSEPYVTELGNPGTKLTLCKIGDTLVLVNNFTLIKENWRKRTNLQIYTSVDNGATWQYKLSVENDDEAWFYPHAFLDHEKQLMYVAYENSKEHYIKKIPFDAILK